MERTYEIIDEENLPSLVRESSTHVIYRCPFCDEKRGKPDTQGKLYISKIKHVGCCFLCNSVVLSSKEEGGQDELQSEIDRFSADAFGHSDDLTSIKLNFSNLGIHELDYLKRRNRFLVGLASKLGLQKWQGTNTGIVIPFWYRGRVARFQVRFVNPGRIKYYTSPGTKLPYSPDRVFNKMDLIGEDTVTVCEGVFDSIALRLLGYPNPIAILGSSLTSDQTLLLRKLCPAAAFVAMDTQDLNQSVADSLRKIPSISDIHVVYETLNAKDPEEYIDQNYDRLQDRLTMHYLDWLGAD